MRLRRARAGEKTWRRTGDRTLSCQEHDRRDQRKDASSYQKTEAHQRSRNQSRMPHRASQASRVEGLRDGVSMAAVGEKLRGAIESLSAGVGCAAASTVAGRDQGRTGRRRKNGGVKKESGQGGREAKQGETG